MNLSLRGTGLAAAACLIPVYPSASFAQRADEAAGFPSRPIRIVVGFGAGGLPDIYARMIAPKLAEALQQQVIVDNRPSAGGVIATQIVADASPDGYTLLSASPSHVILPAIRSKLPYNTLKDFAGITLTAATSYMLVVPPTLGVKTVQELIVLAKARPGQLNFSSAGIASGTHFAGEMLKQYANIEVIHVPYKGIAEALTDIVAGRVQFTVSSIPSSVTLVKDGRLRALAVTSKKRVSLYPDIPTMVESGMPGYQWDSWSGVFAPAKTPRAIVNKLNREITRAFGLPEIQERLRALGAEPAPTTPAELDRFIAEQLPKIAALAKKAGIEQQ
jgi:tripartite-type tricarboxylate transporter receptor subunit TctC